LGGGGAHGERLEVEAAAGLEGAHVDVAEGAPLPNRPERPPHVPPVHARAVGRAEDVVAVAVGESGSAKPASIIR
jgi:hypothetical protein